MINRILIIFICGMYCFSSNAQRVKYNFNPGWKVFVGDNERAFETAFNDDNWKAVTVPYAWNEDEAFK